MAHVTSPCFNVAIEEKVAHIVFSRPDKLNSMIPEFWNDLPAIVRRQLERAGIENVAARGECTMCHTRFDGRWTFHSYRRDRETRTPVVDVHWSAIAIADR